MTTSVTHACPPEGSGLMPCCGRTPFEARMTDRITLDPELVTCAEETGRVFIQSAKDADPAG